MYCAWHTLLNIEIPLARCIGHDQKKSSERDITSASQKASEVLHILHLRLWRNLTFYSWNAAKCNIVPARNHILWTLPSFTRQFQCKCAKTHSTSNVEGTRVHSPWPPDINENHSALTEGGLFVWCYLCFFCFPAWFCGFCVAFVGEWLLWRYHTLPIYLSIYHLSIYLSNLT